MTIAMSLTSSAFHERLFEHAPAFLRPAIIMQPRDFIHSPLIRVLSNHVTLVTHPVKDTINTFLGIQTDIARTADSSG